MTTTSYIALAILIVSFVLFVTDYFPTSITAICASIAFVLAGINKPAEFVSGFSNSINLFILGISVISDAMAETGCTAFLGTKIMSHVKCSERVTLIIVMALAAIFSMFLSNTSVLIIFLSIAAAMVGGSEGKLKKKNFYMAIGIATVAGGGCTLIGSTTQLAVSAMLPKFGLKTIGMWDLMLPGFPVVILLLLWYYFIGYPLQVKTFDFPDPETPMQFPQKDGNPVNKIRMWIPLIVLVVCIAMTIKGFNLALIGMGGAMFVVVVGCIDGRKMWKTRDWNMYGTIAGAMGFATGIANSGIAKIIGEGCVVLLGKSSPHLLYLAIFVLLAAATTNVVTNIGTALVYTPIVIGVAQTLGTDPMPYVLGVIWGANMPYSTPIGAMITTMTLQGGYRFRD